MSTYNDLHGEDGENSSKGSDSGTDSDEVPGKELTEAELEKDQPPADPFALLLPPTIVGFRFHDKKWSQFLA